MLDTCHGSDVARLYNNFYNWVEVADPQRSFDKTDFRIELTKFRELLLKENKEQCLPSSINP